MREYDLVYGYLLDVVVGFMKTEFDLFGFTVSYWQAIVMEFIVFLVGLFISGILD